MANDEVGHDVRVGSMRTEPNSASMRESGSHYGQVALSDNSRAHLGNNVIRGNLTIEQLNLMVSGVEVQKILEKISPGKAPVPNATMAQKNNTAHASSDAAESQRTFTQVSKDLPNTDAVCERVLAALYFQEQSHRWLDIREAHQRTFGWIFSDTSGSSRSNFDYWLRTASGCYWIGGKPGSGKSTLMKYILQHRTTHKRILDWAGDRQTVVASFFFYALGTSLQQSHEGILRSLLHQIIKARPDLLVTIFPELTLHFLTGGDLTSPLQFHISELQAGIRSLIEGLPDKNLAMFMLIDGVDEYNGDLFDFCSLLGELAESPSIKLLVSSRPIPICHQKFSRYPSLRMQDLTMPDIKAYIKSHLLDDTLLQDMELYNVGITTHIETLLVQKASGVFLWVVLVVKNLLIGLGEYADWKHLLTIVDELPPDLEKLYDHLFSTIDPRYKWESAVLFHITMIGLEMQSKCGGISALQASFFNINRQVHDEKNEALVCTREIINSRVRVVEGRLRSHCRGLLEVVHFGRENLTRTSISYLHRTVAEYLIQYSIPDRLQAVHGLEYADLLGRMAVSWAPTLINIAPREVRFDAEKWWPEMAQKMCTWFAWTLENKALPIEESLRDADEALMAFCFSEGHPELIDLYNWLFRSVIPEEFVDKNIHSHYPSGAGPAGSITQAMYWKCRLPLAYFWRGGIFTYPRERWSPVAVLVGLLTYGDPELSGNFTNAILDLTQLINPNHIIDSDDDLWNILPARGINYGCMSIWQYWVIRRFSEKEPSLRITTAFIKAGADISSSLPERRHLVTKVLDLASLSMSNETRSDDPFEDALEELVNQLKLEDIIKEQKRRPVGCLGESKKDSWQNDTFVDWELTRLKLKLLRLNQSS